MVPHSYLASAACVFCWHLESPSSAAVAPQGAGRPAAARRAILAGVALGLLTGASCCVFLWSAQHRLARLFTQDALVLASITRCMPALLLSLLFDSVTTVLSGAVRGAGRQALGVVVNVLSHWALGLPLAAALALHWHQGAPGLWRGIAISSAAQSLLMAAALGCLDWGHEARRAAALVRSQRVAADAAAARGAGGGALVAGGSNAEAVETTLQTALLLAP